MTTYGIAYGEEIEECDSLEGARQAARAMLERQPDIASVGVVVLDGQGPVFASDGQEIAPTHAPKAELEEWVRHRCAYCYANGYGPEWEHLPPLDDDAAWARLGKLHNPECEWVRTRALNLREE